MLHYKTNMLVRTLDNTSGMTLVELILATVIISLVIGVFTYSLGTSLESWGVIEKENDLMRTGQHALNRMARAVRNTNRVLVPLNANPSRDVLAVAAMIDNEAFIEPDNRADEDLAADMTLDGAAGIIGVDDDGDSLVDEGLATDDDEDGLVDEDPLDGIDNDGDGDIDEDVPDDMNADGTSGLIDVDDDGDGFIDESPAENDDEDQVMMADVANEDPIDPVVFYLAGSQLMERRTDETTPLSFEDYIVNTLAENVILFQVDRLTGAGGETLIEIQLTLDDGLGNEVQLTTRVAPRNKAF